jgi:hypothetical protein
MKKNKTISTLIIITLLLLWIPVSMDKLLNFGTFKTGILIQPFSDDLGKVLIYSLPVLETAVVVLLIIEAWRMLGLWLSAVLMAAFTVYIGIALLGAWEKLPCGCGSVISGLNWKQHFWFNLFFLLLSITGILLQRNLQRNDGSGLAKAEGVSAKRHINKITNHLNLTK